MVSWNFLNLKCLKNLEWSDWFISGARVSNQEPELDIMPIRALRHGSNLYFVHESLMPSSCSAHGEPNFVGFTR